MVSENGVNGVSMITFIVGGVTVFPLLITCIVGKVISFEVLCNEIWKNS